jgi:hypothetical protein
MAPGFYVNDRVQNYWKKGGDKAGTIARVQVKSGKTRYLIRWDHGGESLRAPRGLRKFRLGDAMPSHENSARYESLCDDDSSSYVSTESDASFDESREVPRDERVSRCTL